MLSSCLTWAISENQSFRWVDHFSPLLGSPLSRFISDTQNYVKHFAVYNCTYYVDFTVGKGAGRRLQITIDALSPVLLHGACLEYIEIGYAPCKQRSFFLKLYGRSSQNQHLFKQTFSFAALPSGVATSSSASFSGRNTCSIRSHFHAGYWLAVIVWQSANEQQQLLQQLNHDYFRINLGGRVCLVYTWIQISLKCK